MVYTGFLVALQAVLLLAVLAVLVGPWGLVLQAWFKFELESAKHTHKKLTSIFPFI